MTAWEVDVEFREYCIRLIELRRSRTIRSATVAGSAACDKARVLVGDTVIVRSVAMSVAAVALVVACGGGTPVTSVPGPTAAPGQTATPAQSQTPPSTAPTPTELPVTTFLPIVSTPPSGAGSSVIHVVVGGGPNAGTYDATGDRADCNLSPTGSGATYADLTRQDGIGSFSFSEVNPGTTASNFYFQLLFAPIGFNPPELLIDTLIPGSTKGSGTGTLEDKGATIKWTIEGASSEGVPVSATIECGAVDRPSF